MALDLTNYIASIRDFPTEGILFRDVTPIVSDPEAYREAIHQLADYARSVGADVKVARNDGGKITKLFDLCDQNFNLSLSYALCNFVAVVTVVVEVCVHVKEFCPIVFALQDRIRHNAREVCVGKLGAHGIGRA